jgi:hypothetical protein
MKRIAALILLGCAVVAVFIAAVYSPRTSEVQARPTPAQGYMWWIRMIPKHMEHGNPSYAPSHLKIETRFEPVVIKRDEDIWEIAFKTKK